MTYEAHRSRRTIPRKGWRLTATQVALAYARSGPGRGAYKNWSRFYSRNSGAALASPDLQLILVLDSRPLEGSPPLLASLRLLPLALDRRLLVVRSPLHLLEESPLEHHLLEGLQGGFDLVVRNLDLRPGQTRHRPRKCEVERYGRGGSDRSTVFICPSRRVPSATAIAIVPNTSRDSSTSSPA